METQIKNAFLARIWPIGFVQNETKWTQNKKMRFWPVFGQLFLFNMEKNGKKWEKKFMILVIFTKLKSKLLLTGHCLPRDHLPLIVYL